MEEKTTITVEFMTDLLLWDEDLKYCYYLKELHPEFETQDFPWKIECDYIDFYQDNQEGNVGIDGDNYSFDTQGMCDDYEDLKESEVFIISQ